MLYCFLQDKSLHARGVGPFNDAEINTGWGFVTDVMKSYFQTPITIADNRATRLLVETVVSTLAMDISFDSEFDTSTIDFDAMTSDETNDLFNVIELLAYTTDTVPNLESLMVGAPSEYSVYVPNSLSISPNVGSINFYQDTVVASPIVVTAHDFITFDAIIGGVTESFTVWIKNDAFLQDYPNTFFVKAVWPADPNDLFNNPGATILNTIADNSTYIFGELESNIAGSDNTGLARFNSQYIPSGSSIGDEVIIGALFKGKFPGSQALRDYLKTELLSLNIAIEDTWKLILPDLFIDGGYFLIPMWDRETTLPGPIMLPQGILTHKRALDLAQAIFPAYSLSYLTDNLEVLVAPSSEFYIIGIADVGNTPAFASLLAEHPTYQPVDATVPYFANQEAQTQDFNMSLSSAMAVLTGASNTAVFNDTQIDGRTYLTFVSNSKEYRLLKFSSFPGSY